jgi:hypothetical protein
VWCACQVLELFAEANYCARNIQHNFQLLDEQGLILCTLLVVLGFCFSICHHTGSSCGCTACICQYFFWQLPFMQYRLVICFSNLPSFLLSNTVATYVDVSFEGVLFTLSESYSIWLYICLLCGRSSHLFWERTFLKEILLGTWKICTVVCRFNFGQLCGWEHASWVVFIAPPV